jgi:hypothetical protein
MKFYLFLLSFLLIVNDSLSQNFPEKTGEINTDTLALVWFKGQKDSLYLYAPNKEIMSEIIPKVDHEVHAEIALGTWCEDSYLVVPQMISTLEKAGIRYTLTGVNRLKACPFENEKCQTWDIVNVPTLKLFKGKNLLGVIVEFPRKTIESDLAGFLFNR